jgi:hypothetical protein
MSNGYDGLQQRVTELFAYKAEWLRQEMFELYTEPAYFSQLTTNQPCVLVGGRGTGKTTVLRGLSYEGQSRLTDRPVEEWSYVGLYYRVQTHRVRAFTGLGLTDEEWERPFGHFLNLLICGRLLRFLQWYHLGRTEHTGGAALDGPEWRRFERAMMIEPADTLRELSGRLDDALLDFEVYINNLQDEEYPRLTVLGVPIEKLFEAARSLPGLEDKLFFVLVDEYENFSDYQQRVVNTLLKHAEPQYCFKLGVRELGWRTKVTLQGEELRDPSDYQRIDIEENLDGDAFREFARRACNDRIQRLAQSTGVREDLDIADLLPGLSMEEEAERLGVRRQIRKLQERLAEAGDLQTAEEFSKLPPLFAWFLNEWAEGQGEAVQDVVRAYRSNPGKWTERFENNYKYPVLFSIKQGRRGTRKYYAGWGVYLLLASNNIRYILQLVEECLRAHIRKGARILDPVSPEVQTEAAQQVGLRHLRELEGIDVSGAKLTKLVLGLGRLFQIMAWHHAGHAPEVNQFTVVEPPDHIDPESDAQLDFLLEAAVRHLVLKRSTANKLGTEGPREFDYAVHPIFSAFFQYSHRKKRKMSLRSDEVLGFVNQPDVTLRRVLARSGREGHGPNPAAPEQLHLFMSAVNASS